MQNPAANKDYFLGSKENPLATNFVCKEELATSLIRCASSATSRAGRLSKKEDQDAILEHCDKGGHIWLDEASFKAQKVKLPQKYQSLLGDANGHKAKFTNSA